jgi:8-oxo-dGTP diphosphatase
MQPIRRDLGAARRPLDRGETARQAGARELAEETGLHVPADELVEIGVYDAPGRDPRGRYVSAAFGAVLDNAIKPSAGDDAAHAQWKPAMLGPVELAFDHRTILADAVARVAVGHRRSRR